MKRCLQCNQKEILKGHSHAILVHLKNKKYVLSSMNTETIFCRLLLWMARMEVDCNLKKLG